MVVGARSRTLRLSARQSGCFQRREHGRYLSPISTWKPQEKRMPIAVSNSGFHNSPRHPVANHVESHRSKARKFYLANSAIAGGSQFLLTVTGSDFRRDSFKENSLTSVAHST